MLAYTVDFGIMRSGQRGVRVRCGGDVIGFSNKGAWKQEHKPLSAGTPGGEAELALPSSHEEGTSLDGSG